MTTKQQLNEKDKIIEALSIQLKQSQLENENQKIEMEFMKQEIQYLKNQKYGRRSEKLDKEKYPNLFNYDIFNEAEDELLDDIVEPTIDEEKEVTFKAGKKKQQNLINKLKNIETKTVIHDISDEEKGCSKCGSTLVKIGETVTEKIQYIPAKLIKIRHIYPTYKCIPCYKDDITNIVKAPYELAFPKAMVDSSVVSHIITEKFIKYVPLYRQEKLFKNIGIPICRANLSKWFLDGAALLKPLVELMHKDTLKLDIVHMDETPLQVIKNCNTTCYMWGVSSSKHDVPIKLYFYKENRQHKNANEILSGFKGYIQSDGYEAYDKVEGCIDVCCFAHARRKYMDFAKISKIDVKLSSSICAEGLKFINDLYKIEQRLQEGNASIEEIFKVRNSESKEILTKYKIWLDENYPTLPKQSKLGKALYYSINNFDNLSNYLLDGRLAIDNNMAERQMKNFVIGRKNFLFCFTERGADSSAIAYSIVETAIANNLNVFEYLRYVFDSLVKIHNDEFELRKLLPYSEVIPEYIKIQH